RASGEVTPSTVAVTPTTTVDTPGTPAVGFSMSAFQRDGPVIVAEPPSAAIVSDGPDTRRHDQVAEPPVTWSASSSRISPGPISAAAGSSTATAPTTSSSTSYTRSTGCTGIATSRPTS